MQNFFRPSLKWTVSFLRIRWKPSTELTLQISWNSRIDAKSALQLKCSVCVCVSTEMTLCQGICLCVPLERQSCWFCKKKKKTRPKVFHSVFSYLISPVGLAVLNFFFRFRDANNFSMCSMNIVDWIGLSNAAQYISLADEKFFFVVLLFLFTFSRVKMAHKKRKRHKKNPSILMRRVSLSLSLFDAIGRIKENANNKTYKRTSEKK